jgi:hypothetical protein
VEPAEPAPLPVVADVPLLSTTGTSSSFTPDAQPANTAVIERAHTKRFIFNLLIKINI